MSLRPQRNCSLAAIGLTQYNGGGRRRTRRGRTSRKTFQIQQAVIETLEQRQLMSGNPIVVSDASDDGSANSLRSIIASAAPGATIQFDPSLNGQTFSLNSPISLFQNVTISLGGASNITIADNSGSIFNVGSGTTVMISGLILSGSSGADGFGGAINVADAQPNQTDQGVLTLANCTLNGNSSGGEGGAIYNDGVLTVTGSTFTGDSASSGGAIYNDGDGTLTVKGSTFNGNSAAFGGAIYNEGLLNLDSSTVSSNDSSNDGGGVYNDSTLTVTNTTFTGNTAEGDVGGGAIYNDALFASVARSTFTGNNATGESSGNAIYNDGGFTILDSTFSGNGTDNSSGGGGAVYSNGALEIANSTFTANTTPGGGGAIENDYGGSLAVTDSTIVGNSAALGSGGGIFITGSGGESFIDNTIVAGNNGINSSNHTSTYDDIDGSLDLTISAYNFVGAPGSSGLSNTNGNIVGNSNPMLGTLQDNNSAPVETMAPMPGSPVIDQGLNSLALDSNGNPLVTDEAGQFRIAGAAVDIGAYESGSTLPTEPLIVNSTSDTITGTVNLTLRQAIGFANYADTDTSIGFSPAVFPANTLTPITLTMGTLDINNTAAIVTITNNGDTDPAISGNNQLEILNVQLGATAVLSGLTLMNGDAEYATPGVGDGGAIDNSGTLTINTSTFTGNTAVNGGAIINNGTLTIDDNSTFAGNTAVNGGAVDNEGNLTVSGSNFSGTATAAGGALSNEGTAVISGSSFTASSASEAGGGIYSPGGFLTLNQDTITGNNAGQGAGVYSSSALLTVNGGVISGNVTTSGGLPSNGPPSAGGGIFDLGTLTINGATISDNSAGDGGGGGIYAQGLVGLTGDTTISNNSSSGGGGGVYVVGNLNAADTTFSGNSVTGVGGGGVYNSGNTNLSSCTFSGNMALGGTSGGAIDNAGGLNASNITLAGNSASGAGGGIFNTEDVSLSNATIAGNIAGSGGGIAISGSGDTTIYNTIIASNTLSDGVTPSDITGTLDGALNGGQTASSNNLIGAGGSGGLSSGANGNLVGIANPMLAPLGNYSGANSTLPWTMPPLPGSPAISGGDSSLALDPSGNSLSADARGQLYTAKGSIDIGAVDTGGYTITPISGNEQSTTQGQQFADSLVAMIAPSNGLDPVNGGILYFSTTAITASATLSASSGTITGGTASVMVTSTSEAGTFAVNASVDGASTDFGLSAIPDSPAIATTPSPAITLGASSTTLTDTAVLSDGYEDTGTITFTLVGPGGATLDCETVSVTGNGSYTTPIGYTLPASGIVTGTYQWNASYTGDVNNNPITENNDGAEQIAVSQAAPTIVTTASGAVTLGSNVAALSDSAVVSGGYNETGMLVFTLSGPGGILYTQNDMLSGNGTYTASDTLPATGTVTGTYTWSVTYAGDDNNAGANDEGGAAEQTVVSDANPTIVSTPSGAITLATTAPTISDSAILAGGYDETGTLVFTLTGPGGFSYTQDDSLSGNGTYTASDTLPTTGAVAGTYTWNVSYAGDVNNSAANAAPAQTAVSLANPTIVTTASTAITLATTAPTISDTAVVAGGYFETGMLVFTLSGPGGVLYTQNEPLTGNGTYTASDVLPTTGMVAGTYSWHVTYAGDCNNNSAADEGGSAEQTIVSQANPMIVSTASGAVTLSTTAPTLSDTAVFSGGYYETGSLLFTLSGPGGVLYTQNDMLSGNGTYTASNTLPTTGTVAGTYTWNVTYVGDANNNSASAAPQQTVVSVATPTIITTASPDVTLSTTAPTLSDTAVFSGGYYETGSLLFTLSGPGGVLYTQNDMLSGNGTYTASDTLPATGIVAGLYTWTVTYAGDNNNASANDQGGAAEQTVVNKAGPAISTTPNVTSVTLDTSSVLLTDTATLSGGYLPDGLGSSITFTLYNPTGTAVDVETAAVSGNGTYTTPNGYTLAANAPTGIYQWEATFGGDSNNKSINDNDATSERVNVSKFSTGPASLSITTTPNTSSVALGASTVTLTDTATLSGGTSPTGTVTFTLFQGTTLLDMETATINGNGSYTTLTGYTLPTNAAATGTYQWDASYGGDANNSPVSESNFVNEQTTVTAASPTIVTTASSATTLVTTAPTLGDSAVVAGGYFETGSLVFTLTGPGGFSYMQNDTLTGNGTYTASDALPTAGSVAGTYSWHVTYVGNVNNNSAVDEGGAAEQTVVSKANPTIISTPSGAITLATTSPTLSDSAAISGGYFETGSIVFTLTGPGGFTFTESDTLSGNGTYTASDALPPTGTVAGTYTWNVSYAGDANNSNANAAAAQTAVSKANPTIISTPSGAITLATTSPTLSDSAAISGGYFETGSIVFTLTGPGGFTFTESDTLSGNGTYTASDALPPTGTVAGTYTWNVSYAGDANNSNANAAAAQTAVSKANPTIISTPSGAITLATTSPTLSDSAAISGGYFETGSIVFTLTGPGGFTFTESDTLSGNGTYTASDALPPTGTVAGTYTWNVSYAGDANNSNANAAAAQTAVSKANPTIISTPSGAITLATTSPTLSDSAAISGGYFETGSIVFTLTGPGGFTFTESDTLSGNGTYTASDALPTTATVAGTYTWNVSYAGNANNNSANAAAAQTVVSKASPALATTPSTTTATLGTSTILKDTATLSAGYYETGTITFTLLSPSSATVDTETATVSGNGTYTTPAGYTLTATAATGVYQWNATYNGDANNNAASDNGAVNERITVNPAPMANPSIVTTPGGTVVIGNTTINGTQYLDSTGNGFSADDSGQGGVTLDLYQESNSSSGLQTGSGGDKLVAATTTAGNGAYSFNVSGAGTYYVIASVPSGYIQTGGGANGSTGNTYYTINATTGHNYSGYNFDDYLIPTSAPTCISYKVTTPSGSSTTVSNLSGNTQQGDTVTAYFTVPSGANDQLTLVSYIAPGSTFSDATAYEQLIYQQATQTYSAGNYSLTVQIPKSYYQIDFFTGQSINQLEPNQNGDVYGPDAANVLYHAEDRFISSDNSGTTAPSTLNTAAPDVPVLSVTSSTQNLGDSATLSGGNSPTGAITFYLFAPGVTPAGNDSNNIYSDTVTVSGNGAYTTASGNHAGGYTPTATGTYEWVAVYGGDAHNNGVTSPYGSEPEAAVAPPSITTTPNQTSVTLSSSSEVLKDTAVLTGGYGETGSITFSLYGPSNTLLDTETVKVSGSGTYTTPTGYTLPTSAATGAYQWDAIYSGDSNNGAASDNNDPSEKVTVSAPATISGNVYVDYLNDGCDSGNDSGLSGVTMVLLNGSGQVVQTTTTGCNGFYQFTGIAPGTYSVYEPANQAALSGSTEDKDTVGTVNGVTDGTVVSEGTIGSVVLAGGNTGINYNFGQTADGETLGCGDTGSLGFWCGQNGQNLINCLNGCGSSTSLGNWLCSTFGNLYGKTCGSYNLSGKSNSFISQLVKTLNNGSTTQCNAEALACAINCYVTNSKLCGTSACSYGFNVTSSGCDVKTISDWIDGQACGTSNNDLLTVLQVMQYINSKSSNGVLYGGNTTLQSEACSVLEAINQAGNIGTDC